MNQIAIYGAQMVAVSVYYALKTLYPDVHVTAFVVSHMEGNPVQINGIPVMTLEAYERSGDKECKILIAVPENFHAEIIGGLTAKGFENYTCIDSVTEAEIMRRFYAQTGQFAVLSDFPQGTKQAELFVGMSKFYKDRQLNGSYDIPSYVNPIQAGAALTDTQVAELRDDMGENISPKNVNYSELTAMYWLSRHKSSPYMGAYFIRSVFLWCYCCSRCTYGGSECRYLVLWPDLGDYSHIFYGTGSILGFRLNAKTGGAWCRV